MIFQKIKAWFNKKEPSESLTPKTKTGILKYFNKRGGYGFISSNQTLKDVYVHVRDAKDRIRKGDKLQFEVERTEKGLRAKNVELVSD